MKAHRAGKTINRQARFGLRLRHGGVRRDSAASGKDVYRITQLMVSGGIFVLLVAVKLLSPKQMTVLREPLEQMLGNNMDVAEVFAAVGNLFDGDDSLGQVYQAVFSDERISTDTSVAEISGETSAEQVTNPEKEAETEYPLLYYEPALPDDVNLQQAVLGFDYTAPTQGEITSYFGYRSDPGEGNDRFHYGLDIAAAENTDIVSFADGVVTVTGESSSYGHYLIVSHNNGATTLYAHCEKLLARSGQTVKMGEKIALMGDSGQATGVHLHFELQQNGVYLNPVYYVV